MPHVHSVTPRFLSLVAVRNSLIWNEIECLPLGQLFGKPCVNFRTVVVLGPRRPVASNPFVFSALSGFEDLYDAFLVNDREELLAHLTRLSLALDFIAVDHPAAIGIRTGAGASRHRAI